MLTCVVTNEKPRRSCHLGRAELNSEFGFVRKQHKWKNIDG